MNRPDYVHCITHPRYSQRSWCDRLPALEFRFMGLDHAAQSGLRGDRIVACRQCVAAASRVMTQTSSPPPPNPAPVSEEKPEHEQHHQQAPNAARAIAPATGPRDGGGDEQGEDNQQDEESKQGSTSLSGANVVTEAGDA